MKAAIIKNYGDSNELKIAEVEKPKCGKNNILIKVNACALNPLDYKVRRGDFKWLMPSSLPKILGYDFAGTVEEVGTNISKYKKGDSVWGMTDLSKGGTNAEYCLVEEHNLSLMPNIQTTNAASFPMISLTAYQSLVHLAQIKKEDNVLIIGSSGGVGSCAVQIANYFGAKVTAVASKKNSDYLRSLGVEKIRTYDTGLKLNDEYDIIFDASGKYEFSTFKKYLKDNGTMVSTLPSGSNFLKGKLFNLSSKKMKFITVKPNSQDLEKIKEIIEQGKLKSEISEIMDLDQIKKAHEMLEKRMVRGKIILRI